MILTNWCIIECLYTTSNLTISLLYSFTLVLFLHPLCPWIFLLFSLSTDATAGFLYSRRPAERSTTRGSLTRNREPPANLMGLRYPRGITAQPPRAIQWCALSLLPVFLLAAIAVITGWNPFHRSAPTRAIPAGRCPEPLTLIGPGQLAVTAYCDLSNYEYCWYSV